MTDEYRKLDATTLQNAAALAVAKLRLPDGYVLVIKKGEPARFVELEHHTEWTSFAEAMMDKGADEVFLYCVHSAVVKKE